MIKDADLKKSNFMIYYKFIGVLDFITTLLIFI